jgi:hypothetical protein
VSKGRINERIYLATLETRKKNKKSPNSNKLPCYFEACGVVLRGTWQWTASQLACRVTAGMFGKGRNGSRLESVELGTTE